MIKIKTNFGTVAKKLQYNLLTLDDKDKIVRTVATTIRAKMLRRIHIDGKNSKGKAIGKYSKAYLRKRIAANKGKSSRVILSFTRTMQNDFKIIELADGYGLGFSNAENMKKATFAEKRYGKIYGPTPDEKKLAVNTAASQSKILINAKN